MILPPVQDSVALSTRQSPIYFDIRRDGSVTLFSDAAQRDKKPDVLLVLESPEQPWQWQDGWLPILEVGERYKLMAVEDELWLQDDQHYSAYPQKRPLTAEEFLQAADNIRKEWNQWINAGLVLPPVNPRVDAAWRSSLVQALCSFAGSHPSYGAKFYRQYWHDAFPPNVLSMSETLLQFKHQEEALEIFLYYFRRFVRADGSIDYYGPSISEYGGLLWLGALLMQEMPEKADVIAESLRRLIYHIFDFFNPWIKTEAGLGDNAILSGTPEADEIQSGGEYFHNNYQLLRGFVMLAPQMKKLDRPLSSEIDKYAGFLRHYTELAFEKVKADCRSIPFHTRQKEPVTNFQSSRFLSYSNYRYYPELLESGFLSPEDAKACMEIREKQNGEFYGMTLMAGDRQVTDHWPLASYARGLLEYGEKERFLRLLDAHFKYYMSTDVFTAYEQIFVNDSPRTARAPACVPALLMFPRLLAWCWHYRKWDGSVVAWGGPANSLE